METIMEIEIKELVYVVEDSVSSGALYCSYLEQAGYQTRHFTDGHTALLGIKEKIPDVLLQDVCLPDISGLEVMRFAKERSDVPVIIITANSSIEIAVDAMRLGGFDFIEKPFSKDRLMTSVNSACEQIRAERTKQLIQPKSTASSGTTKTVRDHFVGDSAQMASVFKLLESAARSKASIFLTGESGTGKEVCAQALHNTSARATGPFIAINCAAIPNELFESEIFGHEKGAFSGAVSERIGAAEQANGGTLFLDEICEMDLNLQAKLLRFLQTGSFQRVGGQKPTHSDIRIVCATNRDPARDVTEGRFREDLYYRLNVIPVQLPPLRARGNDVIALAQHFLLEKSTINSKHFERFTSEAELVIKKYSWPGNIRELQNVIEKIVVLHDSDKVDEVMLGSLNYNTTPPRNNVTASSAAIDSRNNRQSPPRGIQGFQNIRPLWQIEKEAIESAIAQCEGNIPLAAACLGVSASTIYRKTKTWVSGKQ
jgi:two-component system repressor protein LuxO